MAQCDACGKHENMPYNCRFCGGTYCSDHRLPENHNCVGLQEWNDPGGVFDSGFDDSVNDQGTSSGVRSRLSLDSGPSGFFGYFRGNMTYVFLALMWITYLFQWISLLVGGSSLHNALFTLSTAHPEYVWTWFTSIFAHSPISIFHIVFNSIVIYFFGPLVERYAGSKKFALLFVASGVLAGFGQIGISMYQGIPASVLGASGAALAILGVLTVLNPNLKVYLYFILPVPIWLLTIGMAAVSVFFIGTGGGGSIAHGAHLVGLFIGLAYGEKLKRDGQRAPQQLQFGRGPGGPGGGRGPGRF